MDPAQKAAHCGLLRGMCRATCGECAPDGPAPSALTPTDIDAELSTNSSPTANPQSGEAYKIASSTEYDRLAQDFLKNVSSYTLFHTDVQFNADGRIVASRVHARHAPGAFATVRALGGV